jgi:hypothetical protein
MQEPTESPLEGVAQERPARLRRGVVRRRPSGEPPPLPHELGRSGRFWMQMVGLFIVSILGVALFHRLGLALEGWETRFLVHAPKDSCRERSKAKTECFSRSIDHSS